MKLAASILVILAGASAAFAAAPAIAVTSPALTANLRRADAGATPFTREMLQASLARDLTAHFNLEGDLQLDFVRPWTPPARVASAWQLEILEFPSVPASSFMVRCRLTADGDVVAEPNFVLRASLWRDAWATRAPLVAGSAFDATQLEVRRVDALRERNIVPITAAGRTHIFNRAIPAGRLLTWADVARRPLVKKGELVEVSASEGALTITLKGLAMENGAEGDTILIRNPESRKDFPARVTDEKRVQVRF